MESLDFDNLTLDQFSDFSPQFRRLIGELISKGKTELFRYLIAYLINEQKADNEAEACEIIDGLLVKIVQEISQDTADPNCSDLTGGFGQWINKTVRYLQCAMGEEINKGQASPYHALGTLSHQVVLEFLSGRLPNCQELRDLLGIDSKQMNLTFWQERRQELSENLDCSDIGFVIEMLSQNGKIESSLLNRIKLCWGDISTVKKIDDPKERCSRSREKLADLENLLFPIFGQRISKLKKICNRCQDPEYIYLLTLMTWASSVIYGCDGNNRGAIFSEIPALSSCYGSVGGRIDGVRIVSADTRPLSDKQRQMVQDMANHWNFGRYRSTGHLVKNLSQIFGQVQMKIFDLKFAVGDDLSMNSIIEPSQVVQGGFSRHLKQIFRYLALSNWDAGALLHGDGDEGLKRVYFPYASLIYLFPFDLPMIDEIKLDQKGLKDAFFDQIHAPWIDAQKTAGTRQTLHKLVKSIVKSGSDKKIQPFSSSDKHKHKQRGLFFEKKQQTISLKDAINGARQFIDPETKIIEFAGWDKNDNPKYYMHYDRLLKAINAGLVKTDGFDPEIGGVICCLDNDHMDKTPSMSVRLKKKQRGFYCFGLNCQIKGGILWSSIPSDLKIKIHTSKPEGGSWKNMENKKLFLSDRHFEVMAIAQEFLSSAFVKDTKGQNYLKSRGIQDMELSHGLGIGFGGHNLIKGLLERQVTFEEMIYYGFLGFSNKIKANYGICPIFLDYGLSLNEIKRMTKYKKMGLPYLILNRRVTIPLSLPDGRITSFYGRATWTNDKKDTHRKLKSNHPGFIHGAANMQILKSGSSKLIIVEGVMDLLSLYQMGAKDVMALVGVKNRLIFQSIAQSNRETIFAGLDNDLPGQGATKVMFENLSQLGFKGELKDLTAEFLRIYPQCQSCKDFNKILQDYGSFSLAPFDLV